MRQPVGEALDLPLDILRSNLRGSVEIAARGLRFLTWQEPRVERKIPRTDRLNLYGRHILPAARSNQLLRVATQEAKNPGRLVLNHDVERLIRSLHVQDEIALLLRNQRRRGRIEMQRNDRRLSGPIRTPGHLNGNVGGSRQGPWSGQNHEAFRRGGQD